MIKKIFIIAFILITPLTYSQVRFGVFVDPKLSWFTPSSKKLTSEGVRPGINYGFNMDLFFADNYAFSTGLSINQTGGSLTLKDSFSLEIEGETEQLYQTFDIKYKLQYIQIPIGLKFLTNEIGYTKIYCNLGITPEIGIKSVADIPTLKISNGNISEEVSFMNLSYHIGAGVEYSLGGSTALNLGIMYHNGFWDVTKFEEKVSLSNVGLRIGIIF